MCEKLKSLLKFGIRSTRYKDIFDLYYLINNNILDKNRLFKYIELLIFKDENITQKTINDITVRMKSILNNRKFISKLDNARSNWINMSIDNVVNSIISYFGSLENIQV